MKSKAMILSGPGKIEMDELDVPGIAPNGGLLRVEACGLCGTDVEQFRGTLSAPYPLIPGHEPVGVVEELGAEAAKAWKLNPGDRIALVPFLTCGRCAQCMSGNHHLCRSMPYRGYGFVPRSHEHGLFGGYSEYLVLHPATIFCKVPANVPASLASLYQAVASGWRWAVDLPATAIGDAVLVMGSGQRGLAAVFALKLSGAGKIIVTGIERDAYKLELAKALGATDTIVVDRENVVERVMELTNGEGVDAVLDAVPAVGSTIEDAIGCVRLGGTVVLAGLKGDDTRVPIKVDRLAWKDVTLRGVFAQPVRAYHQAFEILASHVAELAPLHTHEYKLADVERAIAVLGGADPNEHPVSVSIHPGD